MTIQSGVDNMGRPRPHINIERGGYVHMVLQMTDGKLLFENPELFSNEVKETCRCMFLRYNCAVAERGGMSLGRRWVRFPGDTISVGLVACCGKKRDVPSKAKDLYLSDLFRKSRHWAETYCDDWGILSAKYGLVGPEEVIEPYDERLSGARANPWTDPLRFWSSNVGYQAYMRWGEDTHYYLLAGELYRAPFEIYNNRGFASTAPFKGLGIGEQLGWLKNELKDAPAMEKEGGPRRRKLKFGAPRKAKE